MPHVTIPSQSIGGMKAQSPYNPNLGNQKTGSQQTPTPILTESEESILNAFERYKQLYTSVYQDDNKQKDFNSKIQALSNKLRNHEIKQNLLNILIEFINGNLNIFLVFFKKLFIHFQISV